MKAFKLLLVLVAVVIVLVVGILVYLVNNLNEIVEQVVESEGPKITQTEVTLGGVDIQLRQGRGELTDLIIANPEEFTSPNVLHAEKLVLQVEPRSVVGDVIVINDVVVEGVTMTAEQQGMTTNLQVLLESVQEATAGPEPATEEEGGREIRLMVERLRFADNSLNLITEEYGEYTLDMPAFELTNLGTREQGLTPAELGKAILEPLLVQARETAQKRLQELLQDKAEEELKEKAREELGDDAERKIEKLRGLLN